MIAILALTLAAGGGLKEPVKILAAGAPIDVELGHAAPLFADFDGDGLEDLAVGQFGQGRLRIYKNVGQHGAPRFEQHAWFTAAGGEGSIPSG